MADQSGRTSSCTCEAANDLATWHNGKCALYQQGRVRSTYESPTEIHRSTSGRVQPADEAAARLRAWLCRPESRYWTEDGEHTVGDDVATILAAWDELTAPARKDCDV